MIKKYIQEIKYLKWYIIVTGIFMILNWAIYLVLKKSTLVYIGKEDGIVEWIGSLCLLSVSIMFFILFLRSRRFFLIFFSIIFFIGFGEDISWGYHIFNYKIPEKMMEINVSRDFNLHNIEIFNTEDFNGKSKTGFARLLEIDFMFKVFTILYGILLPFLVFHFKIFSKISTRIKLPVPPISIGIFFLFNWVCYRIISIYFSSNVWEYSFDRTFSEVLESVESFIFLVFCFYFYFAGKKLVIWDDIKHSL